MADVKGLQVPIVVTYNGKGTKQAEAGLLNLEGAAKKLGKTFAGIFAAQKITQFATSSVQAFAADQAAAISLSNTLHNLGLSMQGIGTEQFIQKLQNATGVLDDELRPALATLVRQTMDVKKAQDLLTLSLDVARGTGNSVVSVSEALAKAYGGNMKGLQGLNAGLTKADIASGNFLAITEKLQASFKGEAAAYAETFAGKIDLIKAAYSDLKESVGGGIIEGFANLFGQNGDLDSGLSKLRTFGIVLGAELAGLGAGLRDIFETIANMPVVKLILKAGGAILGLVDKALGISKSFRADIAAAQKKQADEDAKTRAKAIKEEKAQAALRAQYAAEAKKQQDAINKKKNEQIVLDKAALSLKKASSTFDQEKIQLAAALASAQTEEDKARLTLKKDILLLEEAISNKDTAAAIALSAKVDQDRARLGILQAQNAALDAAHGLVMSWKPFDLISQTNLDIAIEKLKRINQSLSFNQADWANRTPEAIANFTPDQEILDAAAAAADAERSLQNANLMAASNNVPLNINLNVTTDSSATTAELQDQTASGVKLNVSRNIPTWML